ncbi:MAG: rRNA pseudouridine synthase [Anaerolineales bacterium]|nr:MAG: rRNA pseudouridine synthase [Anaerolineales bacterium]
MEERLQKILARAGFGSRRNCEELIRQRRVLVNGQIAILGQKANPEQDQITVDGQPVRTDRSFTYIALYKPRGVLSAERDDSGRLRTVRDLVPLPGHLYPVGRLDLKSEGLILLTNDGELANLLTHPRYEHPKEYYVDLEGHPEDEALERWRRGLFVDGRRTAPADVSVVGRKKDYTRLRIVLREGRKRQIRKIAAQLGHPVRRLIRVRIGPVQLGDLQPEQWRPLSKSELKQLRKLKQQKSSR